MILAASLVEITSIYVTLPILFLASSSFQERLSADNDLLQQHLSLTRSHLHGKTKEVFVFTDDINALRRIGGCLPHDQNGDMASHLEAIARHSETLNKLGVHVELHLSIISCLLHLGR